MVENWKALLLNATVHTFCCGLGVTPAQKPLFELPRKYLSRLARKMQISVPTNTRFGPATAFARH
jgi:hypothetical protein